MILHQCKPRWFDWACLKRLVAILFLLMPFVTPAAIYKWRDKNGELHFSDMPHQGAQKIELPEVQVYKSGVEKPVQTDSLPTKETNSTATTSYQALAIVAPTHEQTIWSNLGEVTVKLLTKPPLAKGDTIQLFVDGKAMEAATSATTFSLTGLDRGSHTLAAAIFDANGKEIKRTSEITFYMRKHILR